jgi:hypothetical protein
MSFASRDTSATAVRPATSSRHRRNAKEMGDDHPHITQTTVQERPNQVGRKHPPQTAPEG